MEIKIKDIELASFKLKARQTISINRQNESENYQTWYNEYSRHFTRTKNIKTSNQFDFFVNFAEYYFNEFSQEEQDEYIDYCQKILSNISSNIEMLRDINIISIERACRLAGASRYNSIIIRNEITSCQS